MWTACASLVLLFLTIWLLLQPNSLGHGCAVPRRVVALPSDRKVKEIEAFCRENPAWKFVLLDNESNRGFMQSLYSDLFPLSCLDPEVTRLCFLHKYGGVRTSSVAWLQSLDRNVMDASFPSENIEFILGPSSFSFGTSFESMAMSDVLQAAIREQRIPPRQLAKSAWNLRDSHTILHWPR